VLDGQSVVKVKMKLATILMTPLSSQSPPPPPPLPLCRDDSLNLLPKNNTKIKQTHHQQQDPEDQTFGSPWPHPNRVHMMLLLLLLLLLLLVVVVVQRFRRMELLWHRRRPYRHYHCLRPIPHHLPLRSPQRRLHQQGVGPLDTHRLLGRQGITIRI
jgi:hypothetical protein